MEVNVTSIIIKNIKNSKVWIIVPIALTICFISLAFDNDSGSSGVPYTVSVSEYHRSDGTKVKSHTRRPPGSSQSGSSSDFISPLMLALFGYSSLFGIASIIFTTKDIFEEIENRKKRIGKIQAHRALMQKCFIGRKEAMEICNELSFDELIAIPQYLKHEETYKCRYRHDRTPITPLYVEFKAIKYTYQVCLEHVAVLKKLGRGQPRSKYLAEIEYLSLYKAKYNKFKTIFLGRTESFGHKYSEKDLQDFFYFNFQERLGEKIDSCKKLPQRLHKP